MADEFGISSVSNGYQSQSELLVQSYIQAEQPKVDAIAQKKVTLERTQSFFNNLYSRVNAISTATDNFIGSDPKEKFKTRKVTASDESVVSVSAGSEALKGINTVKVNRLASYDILVSDQIDLTDDNNSLFTGPQSLKARDYSFKIATIDDEGNDSGQATITVNLTGDETNEEALTKIVNAINNTEDIVLTASLIKDTENSGRLTFISNELGSNNRISIEEVKDGDNQGNVPDAKSLFSAIGISDNLFDEAGRVAFTDTTAGYKTVDLEDLNAKLEINSIPITRGSNTIEDVLPGISVNLLKPQDDEELPITLTTDVDRDEVEELIQPMLTAYNDLLKYLNSDKTIMRSDSTVSGLYNRVRLTISDPVTRIDSDDFRYLTEIGIAINADGSIGISDREKLEELLEEDPYKVAHLFVSEDSFANKLSRAVENLAGSEGIIQARKLSLSNQIDTQVKRQEELELRIEREAQALRKEYESMLSVFLEAQGQYNLLSAMPSTDTSGLLY